MEKSTGQSASNGQDRMTWHEKRKNGGAKPMTACRRQVSNAELNFAQMTAARLAELESATEARLTTQLHSSMEAKTEKPTSGFYVPIATVQRPSVMLLKKRPIIKPKSTWPRSNPSPADGLPSENASD